MFLGPERMDEGFGFEIRGQSLFHDTRKKVMEMNFRRHSGLTLIGFLIVLVVVLFFAYAGMRLVPTYLEYEALISAMNKLKSEPLSKDMSPDKIKNTIMNNLWVSYATDNITRQNIHISKKSDGVNVRVAYEVRKDFLGNVDLVASFDRTVVLR